MIETSIIIRTKNEERWIGKVLEILSSQTYQDFEVIIVDSGSKDRTLEIAKKFPKVRVLKILSKDFSYPYALNFGIKNSKATKYICCLSGHSVPTTKHWLEDGIKDFGLDPKVMGVYGTWKALPDATVADKSIIYFFEWIYLRHGNPIVHHNKSRGGILQNTNSLFKKSFWDKRHFNEEYGHGGEDQEWAEYWINKGYKIVMEKKFSVHHSHYLSFPGWVKQYKEWKKVLNPAPFKPLAFRKSPTHSE